VVLTDTKNDKEALRVKATFEGHFHGASPIQREHAERFVSSELRVVVWPYFRQFISDTTARMSVRPIFIPVYLGQTPLRRGLEEKSPGRLRAAVLGEGADATKRIAPNK
jgi:hypothetical protein